MENKPIDIKAELRAMYYDNGLLQRIDCSPEQNREYADIIANGGSLPEGVHEYKEIAGLETFTFYTVYDSGLTDEEKLEYINLKQLETLQSIRRCVVFFTVLTIIGLIISLLVSIGSCS